MSHYRKVGMQPFGDRWYDILMKISVEITDAQKQQLEEMARQYGLGGEQLASAALQDLLTHVQAEFEAIIDHILKKNHELYKRLS